MKFVKIQEAEIPTIGLGTWRLQGQEAENIVAKAIELGYRHIDTAEMYENESAVGKGIQHAGISREELFVTTKVWHTHLNKLEFIPAVEESLKRLHLDQVDLLLIHWPPPDSPIEEGIAQLIRAQEMGLTRFIGVSNFNTQQLEIAFKMQAQVITNQVEYHPFLDQSKVLEAMYAQHASLTAYRPLAQGAVLDHPFIQSLAQKYQKTAAQIVLGWLTQQKNVIAIPKTQSLHRLEENKDIFDFELSESEMQEMTALTQSNRRFVNPDFAPEWDQ